MTRYGTTLAKSICNKVGIAACTKLEQGDLASRLKAAEKVLKNLDNAK